MKKLFVPVAVMMFLIFSFGMANANLIVNGSFEDPVIGGPVSQFGEDEVTGWNSDEKLELQSSSLFGPAADGDQYLELDALTGNDNPWVTQTFNTEVGQEYTFRFAFSPRPGVEDNILEVGIWSPAGDHWLVHDNSIAASGVEFYETDWKYYTYTFIADADYARVSFRDAGADDSVGTLVDDVSVFSAPEPATMLLLSMGLIGLAGFGRKKFKK